MKKLIVALSIAALAAIPMSGTASAANAINGAGEAVRNIADDAVNGVGDIVNGARTDIADVVPGGDSGDVVPGGDSGNITDVTDNGTDITTPSATTAPTTEGNNEPTGIAAAEFLGLSIAAVGGLATMALTIRKRR